MRRAVLLSLVALVGLALPAPSKAEGQESADLAAHLMSLMVPDSESDKMVSVLAQLMQQNMEHQVALLEGRLVQLPPETQAAARQYLGGMSARYAAAMTSFFGDLELGSLTREIYASAYVERFSSDELRQLIAFYESPVGRRVSQENSEVAQQVIPQLMQHIQPQVEAFSAKFMAGEQEALGALLHAE